MDSWWHQGPSGGCQELGNEVSVSSNLLDTSWAFISLKSSYNDYQSQLGETGHGLIVSDKEDEIAEGTEISNVYGE